MSIIPWRNKGENDAHGGDRTLSRLRNEVEGVFERFFRDPWGANPFDVAGAAERFGGPRVDLSETDTELTARVELPGVDPKDIDIRVTTGMLTLRGEKRESRDERRGECYYSERQYGAFSRSVPLPSTVDAEAAADATYRDGVLTITLKKAPSAKSKKVAVRNA